jgi:hypothetical protein
MAAILGIRAPVGLARLPPIAAPIAALAQEMLRLE